MKSPIQSAIEKHAKKQLEKRLRSLEDAYLNGPGKGLRAVGIMLAEGEADIVLPRARADLDHDGGVLDEVGFKLMSDSAIQAVKSICGGGTVRTSEFSITLTHAKPSGNLVAGGRYVGRAGKHFLADAILTDADGLELGRGEGVLYQVPPVASGEPKAVVGGAET